MQLRHFPNFPSRFVPPRQVDVWLPPGFSPDAANRYPVLYMHDGQNLFEPERSFIGVDWGIDPALTRLVLEEGIQPPIVVGIWNSPNRMGEYMPEDAFQTVEAKQHLQDYLNTILPELPFTISGNAYLSFLVQELKPWVDANFPTLTQQKHTYIMGSSMGGLISIYALCRYPEIFGGAACLANAWNFGDEYLLEYFRANLPSPQGHKLYLDMGGMETDMPDLNTLLVDFHLEMGQAAEDAGYIKGQNLLTKIFETHTHSEIDWRKRVHIPLKFLLTS